jgi:hypothetical protein
MGSHHASAAAARTRKLIEFRDAAPSKPLNPHSAVSGRQTRRSLLRLAVHIVFIDEPLPSLGDIEGIVVDPWPVAYRLKLGEFAHQRTVRDLAVRWFERVGVALVRSEPVRGHRARAGRHQSKGECEFEGVFMSVSQDDCILDVVL